MSLFVKVPHALIDDNVLLVGEKMTAVSLLSYRNYISGECFPSIEKIASRASCACARVRKALKKLEEMGYIKIIRRPHLTNKYIFSDSLTFSGASKCEKFAKVRHVLLDDKSLTTMYDKIVFIAIIRCSYGYNSVATKKKICQTTNCALSTVKKALLRLMKFGYITQTRDFYTETQPQEGFLEKVV